MPIFKITLLFLFLSISYTSSLIAGSSNPDDKLIRLERVISAFYDSKWIDAQEELNSLMNDYPNDTSVHFFDSMIPFWKYFFGGSDPQHAQQFLERSDNAIRISERHLRKAPRDTSTVLLLSGLYGYRSLVAASEKEYRVAVRSGMTGFSYTRQLLALNSDDPNAQLGRGVFNYMMGSIPREIRWATSFAGMSGDRELGFQYLHEAASSNSHVSIDALMILTYLYFRDELFEDAFKTSSELVERHPDNVIFRFFHGKSASQTGRKQLAAENFRTVIDLNNEALPHLINESRKHLETLASAY
jgi:tetratricopeptide (TPR) repeat protein